MATLHTSNLDNSDSENDEDYVPTVEHDSESSDDEHQSKKVRHGSPLVAAEDPGAKKSERDALWARFEASVSNPASTGSTVQSVAKMVKIEKRYRFAGQEVVEVLEVLEDSADAKKWPRLIGNEKPTSHNPPPLDSVSPKGEAVPPATNLPGSNAEASSLSAPPPDPPKRPPPRKARGFKLSVLSTAAPKPKKMSTLEKAAMDWNAQADVATVREELEANRRANANGAGYLEKVEFLNRVDQRKDEAFEASKGSKRRRPGG